MKNIKSEKIKFSLNINGVKIKNIIELKLYIEEGGDPKYLIDLFKEGQMIKWLNNQEEENIVTALEQISLQSDEDILDEILLAFNIKGTNYNPWFIESGNKLYNQEFVNIDLSKRDLNSISFSECKFDKTSFSEANLENAIFKKCIFNNVDFSSSNLASSNFDGSRFYKSNFTSVKLEKSILTNSYINQSKFIETDMRFSNLDNTILEHNDFTRASLNPIAAKNSEFIGNCFRSSHISFIGTIMVMSKNLLLPSLTPNIIINCDFTDADYDDFCLHFINQNEGINKREEEFQFANMNLNYVNKETPAMAIAKGAAVGAAVAGPLGGVIGGIAGYLYTKE
ncbi:MAG: pentapeptide repeat-containing protein [Neisseriales bacterium]|nr:MAG: pentapeptide repeat-containing protein [Neisseriales bacterium]